MSISYALRAPSKRESNEDDEYSGENKHEATAPRCLACLAEESSGLLGKEAKKIVVCFYY